LVFPVCFVSRTEDLLLLDTAKRLKRRVEVPPHPVHPSAIERQSTLSVKCASFLGGEARPAYAGVSKARETA